MALRTANLRAHLEGEGERRREWGECLVMTSQYMLCSETCLPWQGRVYTDDVYAGADEEDIRHYTAKGYKRLSTAIKGGLFHPNCRHTLSTWFEGISTMPVPHNESEVRENRELAEKESHCKRQIQKYKRLKAGSCDKSNAAKYGKKVNQWQEKLRALKYGVANFDENGIIEPEKLKILQSKIKDGSITLKLNHDTQKNHMKETRIKGKSYFTISEEELQKIVTDKCGTGKIRITRTGQIKETISYDKDIGINVSAKDGTENTTNKFTIHYSKKRTHVVPTRRDSNV